MKKMEIIKILLTYEDFNWAIEEATKNKKQF